MLILNIKCTTKHQKTECLLPTIKHQHSKATALRPINTKSTTYNIISDSNNNKLMITGIIIGLIGNGCKDKWIVFISAL